MLLFEAIERQEEYDDVALRKVLYQSSELESRKFSEIKSYLFDILLSTLHKYEESKFYELKISRLLNNIKILYSRSLFDEAEEQVKKAKRLAGRSEDFSTLIELIEWEKRIPFAQTKIDFLDKHLNRLEEESQKVRSQMSNLIDFRNLYFNMMQVILKNPLSRSNKDSKVLETIINNPLLSESNDFLSHRSHCLYHRILALYNYTKIDYQNFYSHSGRLIDLMESNPVILNGETGEYVSALSNFALSCGLLDRYQEVAEVLPKFLSIKSLTEEDKLNIHRKYYSLAFSFATNTGNFQEGKRLLAEHFKKIKSFPSGQFESSSFYHSYFYICFGVGEYEAALDHLNKSLSLPRSSQRQDLQGIAQILNLIIHYEMGNTPLLDYLFRSAYRFLQNRNRLFQFERLVLKFIRDAGKIAGKTALKDQFIQLKSDFEALEKIPSERVVFQYFDFISWLDSKIKGMPFSQAVKERHS